MATYAYVRISIGKEDAKNQVYEITKYCKARSVVIDDWVVETVCGAKDPGNRKLGELTARMKPGDTIIGADLCRFVRGLYMLFGFCNDCIKAGIKLKTVKEDLTLDESLTSKVIVMAFGMAGEVEREMIRERTRIALARKKAEGVHLGREPGTRNKKVKLTDKEPAIRILLNEGQSYSAIARLLNVDRTTLMRYIKSRCPDIEEARISHAHKCPDISPFAQNAVAASLAADTAIEDNEMQSVQSALAQIALAFPETAMA